MRLPEIIPLGEHALIIRLSNELDRAANQHARALADTIEAATLPGLTDVVAANSSVGIYFDTQERSAEARSAIASILDGQIKSHVQSMSPLHEIAVEYDGPDLEAVANSCGLSAQSVMDIHSSREYQVFAIGFAPGFGYLGEVDERISVPRRAAPRARVAGGTVAIANRQTAIYPMDTPGGWNLIGKTSTRIFDVRREPASLFEVGDRVRFVPT